MYFGVFAPEEHEPHSPKPISSEQHLGLCVPYTDPTAVVYLFAVRLHPPHHVGFSGCNQTGR